MQEEFEDFQDSEEVNHSIQRYEEMLRKKDQYFFDFYEFVNIIDNYITKNDPVRALQVVKFAKEQHPYSVSFLLKEAQLLAVTGQPNKALLILDKAIQIDPSDPDTFMIRGSVFSQLEMYKEAIDNFNQAIPLAEELDELYLNIAYTYASWGDYDKAIDYFKLSLEENLENDIALYEIAYCFDITDRLDESIAFYTKFIDNDPYSYAAWYNLGIVYNKAELYEKALQAYDYAVLIKYDFASAYFNIGNTYSNLEQYDEAIKAYTQTFEYEQPDALTYYNIGECYEKLEKMDEARDFYKKATKLNPYLAEAWFGIGITLDFEDRLYEAVHYIRKALELDANNPEFWFALGDIECKSGNVVIAEQAYQKVIELAPDDPDIRLDYSALLMEQSRNDESIEILAEGIKYNPDNSELYYRLAFYQYIAGNKHEAYVVLADALMLNHEQHTLLFEYLPQLADDVTIMQMIDIYKK
jgi:tetratricopeptide (TPR) repeat protein